MDGAAGWYGKLPQLGDFSQRRLPADFVARWDAWLQDGITRSKADLGSGWLDCYLTAHVWHFVLTGGVLGREPWAGIWMPSVDRVGRYFPVTFAARLPENMLLATVAARLGGWLRELENCARQALDPEHPIAHLDEALLQLGRPPVEEECPQLFARIGGQLERREPLIVLPESDEESFPADWLTGLAGVALQTALAGYSLWWCRGADGTGGGFAHRDLPSASFLTKMVTYSPEA